MTAVCSRWFVILTTLTFGALRKKSHYVRSVKKTTETRKGRCVKQNQAPTSMAVPQKISVIVDKLPAGNLSPLRFLNQFKKISPASHCEFYCFFFQKINHLQPEFL